MKFDANPFEISSSFAEPMFILVNIAGVKANQVSNTSNWRWANDIELDHFEVVKRPIFLVAGESLLDFLSWQRDATRHVLLDRIT